MFRGTGAEFATYALRGLATIEQTMHCLQQSLIELRGDTEAVVETYAIAYHRIPSSRGGTADHVVGVRYLDKVERRAPGPWLIAERVVAYEWSRIDPVGREWTFTAEYTRGHRDRSDAIYSLLDVARGAPRDHPLHPADKENERSPDAARRAPNRP
jgi:hypothetical protein